LQFEDPTNNWVHLRIEEPSGMREALLRSIMPS